jgi:hypothetical protein
MNVTFGSREFAGRFKCEKPWAAISISTEFGFHSLVASKNRVALLQLAFDDWDCEKEGEERNLFTEEICN